MHTPYPPTYHIPPIKHVHRSTHRSTPMHNARTTTTVPLTRHSYTNVGHSSTLDTHSPRIHLRAPLHDRIGKHSFCRSQLRNLVPAAPPSDARCRRSRHRWRWRLFLPGNRGWGTQTNLCRCAVRRTGLWSSRGPRGARHCSRRRGKDGPERPGARRSPPRVSLERPRASAEQLARLGPGRASARRGGVSRGGRARVRTLPGHRGAGRGPRWSGLAFLAVFLHRLWGCSPRPSFRWGSPHISPGLACFGGLCLS